MSTDTRHNLFAPEFRARLRLEAIVDAEKTSGSAAESQGDRSRFLSYYTNHQAAWAGSGGTSATICSSLCNSTHAAASIRERMMKAELNFFAAELYARHKLLCTQACLPHRSIRSRECLASDVVLLRQGL